METSPNETPHRIDVHHHLFPPGYLARLIERKVPLPLTREWSPQHSLDDMNEGGVATAITSITAPGLRSIEPNLAAAVARECNEYAARMANDFSGRFGFFATLPLPDIDGSLAEISHVLDVLGADGIGFLTSYGDKWLGDPSFAPVMDELNRRKAVAYVHPTAPECCRNLITSVPDWVIEFPADTTRTIASLLFSGTVSRCPEIRFVFAHCGGVMPFVSEHLMRVPTIAPELAGMVPHGVLPELKRFYYDTALRGHPSQLDSVLRVIDVRQLLFGTDAPLRRTRDQLQGLLDYGFTLTDLRAIECDNARRLLRRWSHVEATQ